MRPSSALYLATLAVYLVLWAGGIGAYAFLGQPPDGMAWTAPIFLLLAAGICLFDAPGKERVVLLCAGAIGYGMEVLGVHTGYPFGAYHYTRALPPLLISVPLTMVAAWIVLVAYVRSMLYSHQFGRMKIACLGALWMTAIDLVLDPVAAGPMGLWEWDHTGAYYGIPATNFVGWFLVSAIIFALSPNPNHKRPITSNVGGSIVLFFAALAALNGFWIAAAIGAFLLLLHGSLWLLNKDLATGSTPSVSS